MISVVYPLYIPTKKHLDMSYECLFNAKQNTQLDAEWVIVETESKHFIDYADIYIHEKKRTKPNHSINRGFRSASGDYVVFLSNDVMVGEQWLEKMLDCFKNEDCGLASLGNNEHNDSIEDKIIEREYFAVCMMKKEDAYLDLNYDSVFDDIDLIFRLMTQGKKCYKNLGAFAHHFSHSTYGEFQGNHEAYERSRQYFINKYKQFCDHPKYKLFAGIE